MHNPNRHSVGDARRRHWHLQGVGLNDERPQALLGSQEHGRRDVEPDDLAPSSDETKRNDSGSDSNLEDRALVRWEDGIDVGGVLLTSALSSSSLVVVIRQLIELAHKGNVRAHSLSAISPPTSLGMPTVQSGTSR
jgi:hypothetical protein